MTKGFKIFLIVCAAIVALGLLLSLVGVAMGGVGHFDAANITFRDLEEKGIHISAGERDGEAHLSGDITGDEAGTDEFTAIDVKVGLYEVELIESDSYRVEYSYDREVGEPEISVNDGVLQISDKLYNRNIEFDIFKAPFKSDDLYLKIYYPSDANFESVEIDCDLGCVYLTDLTAQKLDIDIDCGDVSLDGVKAESLKIEADLGSIAAKELETNEMEVSADCGDVQIEGTLKGKTIASCELGSLDVSTSLSKSEYDIRATVDLGQLKIDGAEKDNNYGNDNLDAPNSMELSCDAGDINVSFE